MAYELMSNVPPPASATMNPCPEGFYSTQVSLWLSTSNQRRRTRLKYVRCKPVEHARVQTRLSLCHEPYPRPALVRIGDKAAIRRGATHLGLLRALPTVRVR